MNSTPNPGLEIHLRRHQQTVLMAENGPGMEGQRATRSILDQDADPQAGLGRKFPALVPEGWRRLPHFLEKGPEDG